MAECPSHAGGEAIEFAKSGSPSGPFSLSGPSIVALMPHMGAKMHSSGGWFAERLSAWCSPLSSSQPLCDRRTELPLGVRFTGGPARSRATARNGRRARRAVNARTEQSAGVTGDVVDLFRSEAQRYCALVEHEQFDIREVLGTLARLLALGLELPQVEPDEDEAADDPDGLDEDARVVAASVRRTVGDLDRYWEVFDPREHTEPVAGALWDDLVDTYRDLRRGLHLADRGSRFAAVWNWRFSLETHWGNHATDAIRVLFRIVTD